MEYFSPGCIPEERERKYYARGVRNTYTNRNYCPGSRPPQISQPACKTYRPTYTPPFTSKSVTCFSPVSSTEVKVPCPHLNKCPIELSQRAHIKTCSSCTSCLGVNEHIKEPYNIYGTRHPTVPSNVACICENLQSPCTCSSGDSSQPASNLLVSVTPPPSHQPLGIVSREYYSSLPLERNEPCFKGVCKPDCQEQGREGIYCRLPVHLKTRPAAVRCPVCDKVAVTFTERSPTIRTHFCAVLICILCPLLFWIPYGFKDWYIVKHYCSNCQALLRTYEPE